MERDEDFRARIAAAFEGLSVAGPSGAYEFHARSADGRVADASAISPSPASVTITVLSREGNGAAGSDLLAIVNAALNDEDVRPVADGLPSSRLRLWITALTPRCICIPVPRRSPSVPHPRRSSRHL